METYLNDEIWKDVEGYEGLYLVSNKGRICRILKGRSDVNGYNTITLCDGNGGYKDAKVHRLVAQAFIPNPHNYPIINHKDECPGNNHVENLEWCTYSYNINYRNANKSRAEKQYKAIYGINIDTKEIIEFSSLTEARKHGFNHKAISMCLRGHSKKSQGYYWFYKE